MYKYATLNFYSMSNEIETSSTCHANETQYASNSVTFFPHIYSTTEAIKLPRLVTHQETFCQYLYKDKQQQQQQQHCIKYLKKKILDYQKILLLSIFLG